MQRQKTTDNLDQDVRITKSISGLISIYSIFPTLFCTFVCVFEFVKTTHHFLTYHIQMSFV